MDKSADKSVDKLADKLADKSPIYFLQHLCDDKSDKGLQDDDKTRQQDKTKAGPRRLAYAALKIQKI